MDSSRVASELEEEKKKTAAAILIQAAFKGDLSRLRKRGEMTEEEADKRFAGRRRLNLLRKKYKELQSKESKSEQEENDLKKHQTSLDAINRDMKLFDKNLSLEYLENEGAFRSKENKKSLLAGHAEVVSKELEVEKQVVAAQKFARGYLVRKKYPELKKGQPKIQLVGSTMDESSDDESVIAPKPSADRNPGKEVAAATIIQRAWRRSRLKKEGEELLANLKKEKAAADELAKEVDDAFKAKAGDYPKRIDRVQFAHELDQSQRGVKFYNEAYKIFEPDHNRKPLQGNWIDGINGYYQLEYQTDASGNKVTTSPQQKHLGVDRSHLHKNDRICIDERGFTVAEYDSVFALQNDIDKIRRKHDASRLPGAQRLLKVGESRTAFARYKHKVYVDGRFIREEERYVVLTQTRDSFTVNFVEEEAVTGKIRSKESFLKEALEKYSYIADPVHRMQVAEGEAKKAFANNEARYKEMQVAAWQACEDINDPEARQEAAGKMVRQAVREQMMSRIAKEVEEAQKQSSDSYQLDDGDFSKLSQTINSTLGNKIKQGAAVGAMAAGIVVATGGLATAYPTLALQAIVEENPVKTTQQKFQERAKLHLQRIPNVVSNYVDEGVSISKTRRGAKINFSGKGSNKNDIMWVNLPNTSFYVRVACAMEDGSYETFVNGVSTMVFRKAGETWVAENTVFSHDGIEYKPWCVHTPLIGVNPSNSLQYNQFAKTQVGPNGFKGIRKMYDNFALQVSADIGDSRSVTVKVKGYPAASTFLDPVTSKDKDDKRVKFTKKLPEAVKISSMTVDQLKQSPWLEKEAYFKCPTLDIGDLKIKREPTDKQFAAEDAARRAVELIANRFGPMFIKAELGADGGLVVLESSKPYIMVGGKPQLFKKTDLEDALRSQGLNAKDIDKFTKRFFERFDSVKLKGHVVDDQFRQKEESLYGHIIDGDADKAMAIIQEYIDRKKEIDKKITSLTDEEKEAIYRNVTFNINAVIENGQTALHAAAARGQINVVEALINAGANTIIKDGDGKTAAKLARQNGHFDVNALMLRAEAEEIKGKMEKMKQDIKGLREVAIEGGALMRGDVRFDEKIKALASANEMGRKAKDLETQYQQADKDAKAAEEKSKSVDFKSVDSKPRIPSSTVRGAEVTSLTGARAVTVGGRGY